MMRHFPSISVLSVLLSACGGGSDNTQTPPATTKTPDFVDAVLLGGATTDVTLSSSAFGFSAPAANLTSAQMDLHVEGDAAFEQSFVPTGEPTREDFWGLGPAFNHSSCEACHAKDGRGSPPVASNSFTAFTPNESLLVRISLATGSGPACIATLVNNWCAATPVPDFGRQLLQRGLLQTRLDTPFVGQAQVYTRYDTHSVDLADGTKVTLRKPNFEFRNPYDSLNEAPSAAPISRLLQADVRTSPRMGMPVFGLGLIEAINESDILALADPDDKNADGISGRPNYAYDAKKQQAGNPYPVSLGRFGWKANSPNVPDQVAGAMQGDMGITSALLPDESIAGTRLHQQYLSRFPLDNGKRADGSPEARQDFFDSLVFYVRSLHVPARRQVQDTAVRRGGSVFADVGCSGCHQPSFTTGPHPEGISQLSNQKIYPFSDFLLHDMGEGLADNRDDFQANGLEWRTRPLWGLGLTFTVNPLAGLLHDGRAKTIEQAILWHGGEAQNAQSKYRQLPTTDRQALLAFLNSL